MAQLGLGHAAVQRQRGKKPKELADRFRRTLLVRPDEELNTIADEAWLSTDRLRRPPNALRICKRKKSSNLAEKSADINN